MPVTDLDAPDFDPAALPNGGPTPVLFWATWCGFCKRIRPHYEDAAEETEGVPFLAVDISDESSPLWDGLGIEVVPTVIVFEDGEPLHRIAGMLGGHDIEELLASIPT